MLKQRLERIIKNEKEGSPLHVWAKTQLFMELAVHDPRPIDNKITQMDVQARAMTWQKRGQNC